MIQIIDNIELNSKQPNFTRDQFKTLQSMRNVTDSNIDDGHISYCLETDKHYTYHSSNDMDTITGKWRLFKGEPGEPGKPGEPGESGYSTSTRFIFKASEEAPTTPIGGSWNPATNQFFPPEGWSATDSAQTGIIWMSQKTFYADPNTPEERWSTPIRITGENGRDGEDGTKIEYIYKLSDREPEESDRPISIDQDDYVPTGEGWTDDPQGISEQKPYEWVCVRVKSDTWGEYSTPAVWSKWGSNGKDGAGIEYIYKLTKENNAPNRPTGVSQEDEYLPDGWTDDPSGVSQEFPYEWVCVRKYRDNEWGQFSLPALWAKWGFDGANGAMGVSTSSRFVFKASEERPATPTGGTWNPTTGEFIPPAGWSKDDHLEGIVWMSQKVFYSSTEYPVEPWSTPLRITGEDGKDGTDGSTLEYIYKLANRKPTEQDRPNSVNQDDYIPDGWSDNPSSITETMQYEWVCIRTKVNDVWSDFSIPVIWSRWGANGKDGDGVEYIFLRTQTNESPNKPQGTSQEDEWIPSPWTDDPTGVTEQYPYEWVCIRKYRNEQWGEYSNPALWAKYGFNGKDGEDGADGTSVNVKGTLDSISQLPTVGQPGDAYVIDGDLYVWDGNKWTNVGGFKGADGVSTYVHTAYADNVAFDEAGNILSVSGFSVSSLTGNKAWWGVCTDTNVNDPTEPTVYNWSKTKGEKGDTGEQGPQGIEGPRGPAGQQLYTWIVYADDSLGNGISNDPTGKKYIGIGYNKTTPIEDYTPSEYSWSLIKGEDGVGQPGTSLFTWIKYADKNPNLPGNEDTPIYDIPNDNTTRYIGIAINKETKVESNNYQDYIWSLFKGNDGANGIDGRIPYPAGIYDAGITYTCTSLKAPYVLHEDGYWIMAKNGSWLGTEHNKTPKQWYEQYGEESIWQPLEHYKAIYTELLIADGGKLGKFVFNGDYMYSQEGIDSLGRVSTDYQYFLEPGPMFLFTDETIFTHGIPEVGTIKVEDTKITITNNGHPFSSFVLKMATPTVSTPAFKVIITTDDGSTTLPEGLELTWIGTDKTSFSQELTVGTNTLQKSTTAPYIKIQWQTYSYGEITITLVNDVYFIPNFQVNAITGEVKMKQAQIEGAFSPQYKLFDIYQNQTLTTLIINRKYDNSYIRLIDSNNNNTTDVGYVLFNKDNYDIDSYTNGQIIESKVLHNNTGTNVVLYSDLQISRFFITFSIPSSGVTNSMPYTSNSVIVKPGGILKAELIKDTTVTGPISATILITNIGDFEPAYIEGELRIITRGFSDATDTNIVQLNSKITQLNSRIVAIENKINEWNNSQGG